MSNSLNMGTVKTPGVYIDEMSLFPPSVAQVDTAVPAFIGPTRLSSSAQTGKPVRISSMAEFRSYFGGGPDRNVTVQVDSRNAVQSVKADTTFYLFDSVQLYFANGGEKCYIVSTGAYTSYATPGSLHKDPFTKAIDALEKFDEPTLIVIPDAVRLSADDTKDVQQAALTHCHKMQDRFAILDVAMESNSTDVAALAHSFRGNVSSDLEYGAAYFPYLKTSLPLSVSYSGLTIKQGSTTLSVSDINPAVASITTSLAAIGTERTTIKQSLPDYNVFTDTSHTTGQTRAAYLQGQLNVFTSAASAAYATSTAANDLHTRLTTAADPNTNPAISLDEAAAFYDEVTGFVGDYISQLDGKLQAAEAELLRKSPFYAGIVQAVGTQGIVVPPSGAVAGVYARTDADRGVWKSPANVGLNYVNGPVIAITDDEQDGLNVDPEAGKSVNAIRAFSGKGTLVWGARTLAGSDNEWRYVSVRRFFIMAEESIKKATAQFVFEGNDANTWVRVRAMIENFLTLQWRAGALAGTKADNAFFVRVGLGQTMTPQDVLNGFMIIEIGLAVVRPAEFIVLRFSHKMQQA